MSAFVVDARGEQCPIPVVKTRQALQEYPEGGLSVYVSDENAAQNVQRLAQNKGYEASITAANSEYTIQIAKRTGAEIDTATDYTCACEGSPERQVVVAIGSATMGGGSEELGKILMKGFIYALSTQESLPQCVLFYNGGAAYTCEGSPALEDIKHMAEQGVKILTCGTCLDYYGFKEKLAVGQVTNMYAIVEALNQAAHVIKP